MRFRLCYRTVTDRVKMSAKTEKMSATHGQKAECYLCVTNGQKLLRGENDCAKLPTVIREREYFVLRAVLAAISPQSVLAFDGWPRNSKPSSDDTYIGPMKMGTTLRRSFTPRSNIRQVI